MTSAKRSLVAVVFALAWISSAGAQNFVAQHMLSAHPEEIEHAVGHGNPGHHHHGEAHAAPHHDTAHAHPAHHEHQTSPAGSDHHHHEWAPAVPAVPPATVSAPHLQTVPAELPPSLSAIAFATLRTRPARASQPDPDPPPKHAILLL